MSQENLVRMMAKKAGARLLQSGAVRGPVEKVSLALEKAFKDELNVRALLFAEADKLLAAHMREAKAQGLDIQELRERTVAKLARERKLVLK